MSIEFGNPLKRLLGRKPGAILLGRGRGTDLNNPGDTNEHALCPAILVPGGIAGLNASFEVLTIWSFTNSGNAKNAKVRFGARGSGLAGTTMGTTPATSALVGQCFAKWVNDNAANAQLAQSLMASPFGTNTTALVTAAIDTALDTEINISAALAVGSEQAYLRYYEAWLLP